MKMILSTHQVADALLADEYANWTRSGSLALAEWLEEWEEDTGEEMELDVVAVSCDFSEFASLQDWIKEFHRETLAEALKSAGIDMEGDEDEDETNDLIRSHIKDHGKLIEFSEGIIVSRF
tara:strand:+ start:1355 stop:1717 length:363 start_codon:yes stop_codon:yes gene_type:complete